MKVYLAYHEDILSDFDYIDKIYGVFSTSSAATRAIEEYANLGKIVWNTTESEHYWYKTNAAIYHLVRYTVQLSRERYDLSILQKLSTLIEPTHIYKLFIDQGRAKMSKYYAAANELRQRGLIEEFEGSGVDHRGFNRVRMDYQITNKGREYLKAESEK